MAVGVDSSVVGEGEVVVDRESISLSLSFPLDNVLDRSILGNVAGSIDTVGDSCVVGWAVVVGHSVAGNLGLGIDQRVDSWGCSSLVGNSWGCNSVVVEAGESVVGVESAEEGRVGAAEDKSRVGFRLGTGAGGQSENYEHLHAADVDAVDYP